MVAHLRTIDIAESCAKAGVDEADVRRAAHAIGTATGGVSVLEDLGIQMAPHSTLNSYLEKLLVLLTGNLGVPGGVNIHSHFVALLGGGADSRGQTTPVTGHRLVTGLVPCNVIPDEILTDHPDRFRAMLVESGNPAHSLSDSHRMREAMRALDLVVVIDVALTETAREADYVLPAASQYEKWECTFFNLEFPRNVFHLRPPLFEPAAGHAAGVRDPRPAVPRARRVRRRGRGAAAGGRRARPSRVRRGVLRARRRPTRARADGGRADVRGARPDADDA